MPNCALGSPVDPLVYIMTAGSFEDGVLKTLVLFFLASEPLDSMSSKDTILKSSWEEFESILFLSKLKITIVFKYGKCSFNDKILGNSLSLKIFLSLVYYIVLLWGNKS